MKRLFLIPLVLSTLFARAQPSTEEVVRKVADNIIQSTSVMLIVN